ncbi:MAG TPA: AarF/UbiB family protein [Allosphingosinicella sp.]|nr:AarF/UbiB family protein [Allosphingosinicella sp.]
MMLNVRSKRLGPAALAGRLVKLGPVFVKLGQYLALRPDLLPQEYCDELLMLVDDAPPVPWEAIEAVLTEELGAAPLERFASFRRTPLAAGSLAQVHVAESHDGRRLAVKVQRPDIARTIERSLHWIRRAGRLLERTGAALPISGAEFADEIEVWLHSELNFANELDNQLALAEAVGGLPHVRVPKAFPEMSTGRVLTAEYLEGVPFSQLLRLVRAGEEKVIERRGLDIEMLAERLILATYHQMFTARFFHADPHPGNLIAMPGNVIGFIDCGLAARMAPRLEAAQKEFLSALGENDSGRLYRAVAQVIQPGEASDVGAFRRDFIGVADAWNDRRSAESPDKRGDSATASFMVAAMRLARRHRMRVPVALLSVYRTLLTVEAVAQQLGARADLGSIGRRFFAGSEIERLLAQLGPDRVMSWFANLLDTLQAAPPRLQELLAQLTEGELVLTTRSHQSEVDRRHANGRTRLLALAIVSLAPVMALSSAPDPGLTPWLIAALAAVYAGMLFYWQRLK